MQLGKSLVGGIIGAALGIGLLVAIYLLFALDHVGLAVPVAILTGLGVRTMVSTSGHASYARGAITGLLALAAYVGGWYLVADLATRRARAAPKPPTPVTAVDSADAGEPSDAPVVEAPPVQERAPVRANPSGAATRKAVAPGQNPMDYIWLGIAALVAYELGRGTAAKRVEVVEGEETVTTVNVHPDA